MAKKSDAETKQLSIKGFEWFLFEHLATHETSSKPTKFNEKTARTIVTELHDSWYVLHFWLGNPGNKYWKNVTFFPCYSNSSNPYQCLPNSFHHRSPWAMTEIFRIFFFASTNIRSLIPLSFICWHECKNREQNSHSEVKNLIDSNWLPFEKGKTNLQPYFD